MLSHEKLQSYTCRNEELISKNVVSVSKSTILAKQISQGLMGNLCTAQLDDGVKHYRTIGGLLNTKQQIDQQRDYNEDYFKTSVKQKKKITKKKCKKDVLDGKLAELYANRTEPDIPLDLDVDCYARTHLSQLQINAGNTLATKFADHYQKYISNCSDARNVIDRSKLILPNIVQPREIVSENCEEKSNYVNQSGYKLTINSPTIHLRKYEKSPDLRSLLSKEPTDPIKNGSVEVNISQNCKEQQCFRNSIYYDQQNVIGRTRDFGHSYKEEPIVPIANKVSLRVKYEPRALDNNAKENQRMEKYKRMVNRVHEKVELPLIINKPDVIIPVTLPFKQIINIHHSEINPFPIHDNLTYFQLFTYLDNNNVSILKSIII